MQARKARRPLNLGRKWENRGDAPPPAHLTICIPGEGSEEISSKLEGYGACTAIYALPGGDVVRIPLSIGSHDFDHPERLQTLLTLMNPGFAERVRVAQATVVCEDGKERCGPALVLPYLSAEDWVAPQKLLSGEQKVIVPQLAEHLLKTFQQSGYLILDWMYEGNVLVNPETIEFALPDVGYSVRAQQVLRRPAAGGAEDVSYLPASPVSTRLAGEKGEKLLRGVEQSLALVDGPLAEPAQVMFCLLMLSYLRFQGEMTADNYAAMSARLQPENCMVGPFFDYLLARFKEDHEVKSMLAATVMFDKPLSEWMEPAEEPELGGFVF